jgi:hypothetical protein
MIRTLWWWMTTATVKRRNASASSSLLLPLPLDNGQAAPMATGLGLLRAWDLDS